MYHRIAYLQADVWNIAVSPENLEEQLKLLKKTGRVIPLKELVKEVQNKWVKKNSIAITFDDGYADNFHIAKPLLEKYELPATFFIPTINIGQQKEFWWDELEHLILFEKQLPEYLSININGNKIELGLVDEQQLNAEIISKHIAWKAYEQEPPTLRASLFYKIWEALKPLNNEQQQEHLEILRNWIGGNISKRTEYQCMSVEQIKELEANNLFTVEAHSETHAALAFHDKSFQKKELELNKFFLEKIMIKEIESLAYPYGSNNKETILAAMDAGFKAAFTTEEETITNKSEPYRLGRFQVKNQNALAFSNALEKWITM